MSRLIQVKKSLMQESNRAAAALRERFAAQGLKVVNIMGSPGSGKTSLIERVAEIWRGTIRVSVIEGDVATEIDAQRLDAAGIRAIQINTLGACHLDAVMVEKALDQFGPGEAEALFIENIGNLICPSGYDLGESVRIVVASWAEGSDKPAKYPSMFSLCDAVVVNKADLEGLCDFDRGAFEKALGDLAPEARLFWVSCRTGVGCDAAADWLQERLAL